MLLQLTSVVQQIHLGLHTPCRAKLPQLNDANKAKRRNKCPAIDLILLDEMSMVSIKILCQIHKHLNGIFSPAQYIQLGGEPALWRLVLATTSFCKTYIHI